MIHFSSLSLFWVKYSSILLSLRERQSKTIVKEKKIQSFEVALANQAIHVSICETREIDVWRAYFSYQAQSAQRSINEGKFRVKGA